MSEPTHQPTVLIMQAEETSDYVNQDRPVEANQQAEPGPPPYESVMMSGYDGVGSAFPKGQNQSSPVLGSCQV